MALRQDRRPGVLGRHLRPVRGPHRGAAGQHQGVGRDAGGQPRQLPRPAPGAPGPRGHYIPTLYTFIVYTSIVLYYSNSNSTSIL